MKLTFISNEKARASSCGPETTAAWNDHYLVQERWPQDEKFSCFGVDTEREAAERKARIHAARFPGREVRIVKPDAKRSAA